MIEFALHFPETNEPKAYLNVVVAVNDGEFLTASAQRGYEIPKVNPELRGMTFNVQEKLRPSMSRLTRANSTWMVINAQRLTIETIHHEVRHAVFWYLADDHGIFAVNTLDGASEEGINRAIDLSVRRVVHTVSEALGTVIPYFEFGDMPEIEQMRVMERT